MKIKLLCFVLALLLASVKVFSQDIISSSPIALPLTGQTTYSVASGKTVNIIGNGRITLNPGVSILSGATVLMKVTNPLVIAPPPSNPASDLNRNWVMTRTYDENGNEIGATKAFFDNNGKATQAQQKNETTSQVLATQTLYDLQGRAVVSTLPAPINNSQFAYNANFVTSGGTPYSYLNFDGDPTNTTNPLAKLNNPDLVDNAVQGTLGWYYSNNNGQEPMVGASGFPYSRADFYHDGTGAQKRESGIGEQLKMGTGRETSSNSFPVQNELNTYLAIRNQFFPTAIVGSSPTSMAGQALQSISTDQNGTSVLSVTDLTGKLSLMTARADASSTPWLQVTNTLNLSNVQGQYALYVSTSDNGTNFSGSPSGATTGTYLPFNLVYLSINSGSNPVKVYCTDCQVPLIYSGVGNGFVFPGGGEFNYEIVSAYPFSASSSGFYDSVEGTFQESPTTAIQYFSLASQSSVAIAGGAFTLYDMKAEQDITSAYQGNNTLPAGYYKVVATAPVATGLAPTNNVTVSYTNTYSDISYNYYNQLGQLIDSITPNGVQQLLNSINANTLSQFTLATLPFTATYQYDLQGRLVSTTSPDKGTSNFVYRQDGKIRFSQNSYQANPTNSGPGNKERFSYTNYDSNGRPVESGEYAVPGTTAVFAGLAANTTLLEATDATANVANCTKLSNINTYYDSPATNLGLSGYTQDPGFLKGEVSYTTSSVNTAVNSTTWYNYDDHGRVTWIVKQITGLTATTTYKTINYTYNAQGNTTQVAYQQGASDQFMHYYTYDADGRLVNVQTSTDGISMVQQANYYYYLHGPLKRTELGNQLQGMDYVYTPQGWLKAINSPTGNAANDPMQDGLVTGFAKDAFGMQLEYFPGDYSRQNNVASVTTNNKYYYNGNVAGMSWQSGNPSGIPNPPTMYTYSYDTKYQYTGSTWGSPGFTSSPATFTPSSTGIFQENGITYDANGNIKTLQRTNSNGISTPTDNFAYNYYTNPTTNTPTNQLASVANTGSSTSGAPYGTYTYDEIGRLKTQVSTKGTWYFQYDVTGKITGVYNNIAMTPASLVESYVYDEAGNRIQTVNTQGTTYYVYDPKGSVLAIYTQSGSAVPVETEVPVYGSSRLGTYFTTGSLYRYEIRDNVGSIRVVLMSTRNSSTNQANIFNYSDYYPYGSLAQSAGTTYRYAYQGAYAESDQVTGYDNFQLRMYDGRIGRWLSVDPAGQFASPYEGMGNNPVNSFDSNGACDPCNVAPAGAPGSPSEGTSYNYGTNNYVYYDKLGGWSNELNEVSVGPQGGYAYGLYANAFGGQASAGLYGFGAAYDSQYFAASINVNGYSAQAKAKLNKKDGLDLNATASLLTGSANVRLGTKDNNLSGKATGTLLSAKANITIANPLNLNTNDGTIGLNLDAGAGAYVAKGDLSGELNISGVKISTSVTGTAASVHIGLGGGIYYDTNTQSIVVKFQENVGLGLGEGASVLLSFPVK
jgi:RHS repeat-associated protein